jgi:hypothetical protein
MQQVLGGCSLDLVKALEFDAFDQAEGLAFASPKSQWLMEWRCPPSVLL